VLAFLYWQSPQRPLTAPKAAREPITYILAPIRRSPPEQVKTVRKAPERIRRPPVITEIAAPQLAQPVMPALPPPEAEREPQAITQAPPAPDPFALPTKPEDDLRLRYLKRAAAVDRQLRKESWTQRDRKLVNDQTALAAAIGKAYVGGGSGAMEEMVMADGTRMTKWRMPGGGTACFYKESNGFSGGRDPFRDTGKIKIMSCP
jgi:hypothetical protein